VKGLEPVDYAFLHSSAMAGECGVQCREGRRFTSDEEAILSKLAEAGRVRNVPCGERQGLHVELTAAGREALRIYEMMLACERAGAA
jgi:hypothetical protein